MCDYNFIMGDLNYRFESTFEDMIDNDKIKIAPQLIDQYDQLTNSMLRKGSQQTIILPDGSTY
jgi:hypothetical protein